MGRINRITIDPKLAKHLSMDLSTQSKPLLFAVGIAISLLVGVIDYLTGYQISVSVFYLGPICFVTWFVGKNAGTLVSLLSIFISTLSDYLSGKMFEEHFIELWNISLLLCFFLIVSLLLSKLKCEFEKRAELIRELKHARGELERKQDELSRSNTELEQFAYVAAHDLRAPLRIVSGFAARLQKLYQGQLPIEADQYISHIVEGAQRMQHLIDDLIEYARAGTSKKSFVPVDCNIIIEKTLDNLAFEITESGAVITADSLPTVAGDITQLIQLFQNLVGNAIKYSSNKPRIHIYAEQKNGEWLFRVSDNGIGIDPSHFERIFEIFQRLHTRDEYSGTGIGLAICKKIVERHGGRIWLESEIGKGSTFLFSLPKEPLPVD
jgi:signal transduction histidine kinase